MADTGSMERLLAYGITGSLLAYAVGLWAVLRRKPTPAR
jgi:hypothetical protein